MILKLSIPVQLMKATHLRSQIAQEVLSSIGISSDRRWSDSLRWPRSSTDEIGSQRWHFHLSVHPGAFGTSVRHDLRWLFAGYVSHIKRGINLVAGLEGLVGKSKQILCLCCVLHQIWVFLRKTFFYKPYLNQTHYRYMSKQTPMQEAEHTKQAFFISRLHLFVLVNLFHLLKSSMSKRNRKKRNYFWCLTERCKINYYHRI